MDSGRADHPADGLVLPGSVLGRIGVRLPTLAPGSAVVLHVTGRD